MDAKELDTYQVQLAQVDLAIRADPTNAELLALRTELKELIDLSTAALAQLAPSSSSTTNPSAPPKPKKPSAAAAQQTFAAGDECQAKYSGDGAWYPARIVSVSGSAENRVYSVVFKGYDSTELCKSADVRPPAAHPVAEWTNAGKRKLSKEEEEEREKKKKKNEKKLEVRAAKAKEQTDKQQAWKKFAKKGEKKGIAIAGLQGTSIFKSPDNPTGRVGVTGSGKGMTSYTQLGKHKFAADEEA